MISPHISQQRPAWYQRFLSARTGAVLVLLIIFLAGTYVGRAGRPAVIADANGGKVTDKGLLPDYLSKDVSFKLFWEAWDALHENYVDQPLNETQMLYGAIAGMTAAVGDPHTAYFDPRATELFNSELEGSFEGIGAEIAIKKEQLVVVSPLDGSPALKAGLKAGDQILAIDGEDTYGMTLDYAVSKIRGPKGTAVKLTIGRATEKNKPREVEITRDEIKVKSVSYEMKGDIGYIKISFFHDDTKKLLDKAIDEILKQKARGVILDLRGDPGGYLEAAIDVASEWIKDGVVVYEKFGDGSLHANAARGRARLAGMQTVVLVNEGSASASEIVAGALKDLELATIVGVKTFGKGSVQTIFPFSDGSSMKVTIAKWLTPNKNTIDKEGIHPDIEVTMSDEDYQNDRDPQLDKGMEVVGK